MASGCRQGPRSWTCHARPAGRRWRRWDQRGRRTRVPCLAHAPHGDRDGSCNAVAGKPGRGPALTGGRTETPRAEARPGGAQRMAGLARPTSCTHGAGACVGSTRHMRQSWTIAKKWCPGKDSNLHGSPRQHLKLVRLPIPPPGHASGRRSSRNRAAYHSRALAGLSIESCAIQQFQLWRQQPLWERRVAATNVTDRGRDSSRRDPSRAPPAPTQGMGISQPLWNPTEP